LRAKNYGLKGTTNINEIKNMLKQTKVPSFHVDMKLTIPANDEEVKKLEELKKNANNEFDYDAEVTKLRASLPDRQNLSGFQLQSLQLNKDDENSFHQQYIATCSNLRARNYRIKELSFHEILGKLIPAITTSTGLISGLICLEIYKLSKNNEHKLTDYRTSFFNLALPLMTMAPPLPCSKHYVYKKGKLWDWTLWDNIEIQNAKNMTVQDLIDYLKQEWGLDLIILSYGPSILYAFYMSENKLEKRRPLKITKLIKAVTDKSLTKNQQYLYLEISCSYIENPVNEDQEVVMEDPDLPSLRLHIA